MSRAYYLDTSALVKLYHQEAATDQVETLFSDSAHSLIISELAAVELHSTVARKLRTGEISEDAFDEILKNFADDCSQRFVVTPLDTVVVDKARGLRRTQTQPPINRRRDRRAETRYQQSRPRLVRTIISRADSSLPIGTRQHLVHGRTTLIWAWR